MAGKDKRYEAFISYSHEDEAWAGWIHRAIERYRLPRQTALELGRNRRSRPVFRDKEELSTSSDLSGTLQDALSNSAALIVICSTDAVHSEWVNKEIEFFLSLEQKSNIFCLLVDGSPQTSFPPALQKLGTEPLAADPRATGDGRQGAKIKLIAGMLGIEYDTLRQRDRQWQRRLRLMQAAAVSGSAILASLIVYVLVRVPPCRFADELAAEIWNKQAQSEMEVVFAQSGLPYADDAWRSINEKFTDYVDKWANQHEETCKATRVEREQSEQLMDLRMDCLIKRRSAFEALRNAFANPSTDQIENAILSANRLPTLDRCADREALEAAYPLPEDPAKRATIERTFGEIARAKSLMDGAYFEAAFELADEIQHDSSQLNFPPLQAEALLLLGEAYDKKGDIEAAKTTYFDAATAASAANDAELAVRAWLSLPGIFDREGKTEDSARMVSLAEAYVPRLTEDHPLLIRFHRAKGWTLMDNNEVEAAIASMRTSVRIARKIDSTDLHLSLDGLASMLMADVRIDEARQAAGESTALVGAIYGERHPAFARKKVTQARLSANAGEHDVAVQLLSEAVDIVEDAYPSTHPLLASLLAQLGFAQIQIGSFDEAIFSAEKAIRILKPLELWPALGSAHNTAGDAHLSMGNYQSARHHLDSALTAWRHVDNRDNVSVALGNLGNLSNREEDFTKAESYCREALALERELRRPKHPLAAFPLTCLGEALIGQDRIFDALEVLKEAHEIRTGEEVSPGVLAWTRWLYGRALWDSGSDKEQAQTYLRYARQVFVDLGDGATSELADLEAWLSARGIDL